MAGPVDDRGIDLLHTQQRRDQQGLAIPASWSVGVFAWPLAGVLLFLWVLGASGSYWERSPSELSAPILIPIGCGAVYYLAKIANLLKAIEKKS